MTLSPTALYRHDSLPYPRRVPPHYTYITFDRPLGVAPRRSQLARPTPSLLEDLRHSPLNYISLAVAAAAAAAAKAPKQDKSIAGCA